MSDTCFGFHLSGSYLFLPQLPPLRNTKYRGGLPRSFASFLVTNDTCFGFRLSGSYLFLPQLPELGLVYVLLLLFRRCRVMSMSYNVLGSCHLLELKAAASTEHAREVLSCDQAAVEQWTAGP